MAFTKRKRNWLNTRSLFGERKPDGASAVSAEDEAQDAPAQDTGPAPTIEHQVTGDPTQRLLTALGRFQRQVSLAEQGAPQEQWIDECMNQLINGIELAHSQGWESVQAALTDTARVLHSYERAERAPESVHFLKDSYEILCLMVGDIIVDNVRPGVMDKWQVRYRQAVEDLAEARITLVKDEEEAEAAPEYAVDEAPASEPPTTGAVAPDPPEKRPIPAEDGRDEETAFPDYDPAWHAAKAPDNDQGNAPAQASEQMAHEAHWPGESAAAASEETSPFDEPYDSTGEEIAREAGALEDADSETDTFPSLSALFSAEESPANTEQSVRADDSELDLANTLDVDPVAGIDNQEPAPETTAAEQSANASAPEMTYEDPRTPAPTPPVDESEAHKPAPASEAPPEVSLEKPEDKTESPAPSAPVPEVEQQSLFDEEPPSTEFGPAMESASNTEPQPMADSETARESASRIEPEAPGEPEPPIEMAHDAAQTPEPEPPREAVLDVKAPAEPEGPEAQLTRALSAGNVADVKLLALELAVKMARVEAEHAEAKVGECKQREDRHQEAIAKAELDVQACEEALLEVDKQVSTQEESLQAQCEQHNALDEEVAAVDGRIASIEAQIRELEAKRDAERQQREDVLERLQDVQETKDSIKQRIEALNETARASHEDLEAARDHVVRLNQEHRTKQKELDEARRHFEQRKHSVAEIERTIASVQALLDAAESSSQDEESHEPDDKLL
ncbi:MAG: hypothetical protein ACLFTT_11150 [Candidatus Hydrogenedentota bacterium]